MRTFLALELEPTVRKALGRSITRMQSSERSPLVRWVPVANLHITVRFLGEVDEGSLEQIGVELATCCADIHPFDVGLSNLEIYPRRSPRVLWVGVSRGRRELDSLHAAISGALEECGVPAENRRFSPHVTVGRMPTRRNRTERRPAFPSPDFASLVDASGDPTEFERPFRVDRLTLFESRLQRGRTPEYVSRQRYSFDARR